MSEEPHDPSRLDESGSDQQANRSQSESSASARVEATYAPGLPKPVQPVDPWQSVIDLASRFGPIAVVGAVSIVLCFVYGHVFDGPPNGDDNSFHLAETKRIAECLSVGDFDFWNWSANGGYASAYYYQAVPLVTPAALTAASGGHLLFWFQLCMFLPLVLTPVATYRGVIAMGASRWQAALAAAVVPFAISNSRWGHGADGNFSVGLYTQTWAFAAFPLALGRGVQWISRGEKLGSAVFWGCFVGLCHPFAGVALGIAFFVAVWLRIPSAGLVWLLRPVDRLLQLPNAEAQQPPRLSIAREFVHLLVLGALLLIAALPGWITTVVDYSGFGGFPHRVSDEVGPGLKLLAKWQWDGVIVDHGRKFEIIGWSLPAVLLFARGRYFRWLWTPMLAYAALLSIGPHLVTQDDLLPAVRFLGSLQIVMAIAAAVGAVAIGNWLYQLAGKFSFSFELRTAIAAVAGVLIVFVVVSGAKTQRGRVFVAYDYPNNRNDQLWAISEKFADLPQGRKQAAAGAESHWWNLLPYVWGDRPALLQMGGGGLQASPLYDFIWSDRDLTKAARVYFAPYLLFMQQDSAKVPEGETIFQTSEFEIRKLEHAGLVSPVTVTGTITGTRKELRAQAIAWIKSEAPMADQVLAYNTLLADLPPDADGETTFAITQPSPGDEPDIIAHVRAAKPTLFVARTSWNPRWQATLDGAEVPIVRVTPDMPAVIVPPGEHRLTFRFYRPWWADWSWLLWPIGTLIGFAGGRWYRRKSRAFTGP